MFGIELSDGAHDHADQVQSRRVPVALGVLRVVRGTDHAGAGGIGIAGKARGDLFVVILGHDGGFHQIVLGFKLPGLGKIGGRNLIALGRQQLIEPGIVRGCHHNADHIPGGGILGAGANAVDIRKAGGGAAHLLDPLVHHIHKGGPGARHIFGQRHRRVGGVLQNHTVQQIPDRQLLLTFKLDADGTAGDSGGDARLDGDHRIQVLHPLHDDQGVDDLGKGAGGQLHIRVVGIDQGAGIALINNGGLGRIQLPVGTGQGHLAVQAAAAV